MSEPIALEPVNVTVVGGGGTGDGGVSKGTVAVTPADQPNLIIHVVSPLVALAVRFANVYVASIVGLASAAGVTQKGAELLGAGDFGALIYNCALLSVAPAGLDMLKNIVTIFGRLESKYPLLTGQV